MNAITLYYLCQYIVVFVISYFRVRKAFQNQDPTTPAAPKFNWRPVFFVSLEVVYTSAGLLIVLIDDSKEWAPVIIIVYIIFILISSNLTSIEEKFSEKSKFKAHLTITLFIIAGTVLALYLRRESKFSVSIPYHDESLLKISKNKIKRSFYIVVVAKNEQAAIDSAMTKFWIDKLTEPIYKIDSLQKKQLIEIFEKEIIVKGIK